MEHWDNIRHFLAIVRGGTLQAAAMELGVDQSTVFRRLRALETYLGAHVFDRRRRGSYELTPAGESLVDQARRIEDAMHEIEHRVRGTDLQLSGRIRVATADDMAVALLPGHLCAFEREHPEISIEILTANRYHSLARNEADVAIRPGYSTDEERVVPRRVCRTGMGLFASADYLARFGTPRSRADLAQHHLIDWREDLARDNFFTEITGWFGSARQHGSNSLLSIRALALEGLGVALLPEFLGADEYRLQRVLPEVRVDSGYLWLLHHGEMRHNARIRAFIDFMYSALRDDPRLVPAEQSDLYTPVQAPGSRPGVT